MHIAQYSELEQAGDTEEVASLAGGTGAELDDSGKMEHRADGYRRTIGNFQSLLSNVPDEENSDPRYQEAMDSLRDEIAGLLDTPGTEPYEDVTQRKVFSLIFASAFGREIARHALRGSTLTAPFMQSFMYLANRSRALRRILLEPSMNILHLFLDTVSHVLELERSSTELELIMQGAIIFTALVLNHTSEYWSD
ncbi:hypothetical protein M427DRAFT_44333 [Gonapodya prolifera JEL478]|uniref:Uncharacterized protein n=1 Tax=Gonapodya prolifera (strain JEL478) TaxID=1344416 RepID=A0A139AG04_GONPJ|nr:hypothetical protein M427DRAFT_44333 [Gonapodya prolifera JEL478]|eukprot:KXS15741.1 hypothetical protein M427DRAFT_44333 [Gonapodya prolifera JEL478]